jgi:hypothetical protein
MVYFIETINYKALEKDLHKFFCDYRTIGEWFLFNSEKFQELKMHSEHALHEPKMRQ